GSAFTSTLAHAGGPPLALYMLPLRLRRQTLNATTVVYFAVLNWVKLIPYFFLGQLNPTNLATSGLLVWTAPIGVVIGIRLARRTSDRLFYRIIFTLLFLTGVKLLWDALGP
ncbi:MAG: sulfite exporter TauE/SafE family protein, partial [Acetobacteraceae bacterium]|nr:sulfite exporter TauE/SafE family protein [Acetobacteraceae bacterium]